MPLMLSCGAMKHPAQKNFNLFISLLLQGGGAGLILIPGHLGVSREILSLGMLIPLGLACFLAGLALQAITARQASPNQNRFIRLASTVLLIALTVVYIRSGHAVAAITAFLGGIMLLAVLVGSFIHKLEQFDFTRFTIVFTSFVVGAHLTVSGSNALVTLPNTFVPYLAAAFFLTAFLGGVTIILPSLRFGAILNQTQLIPWGALTVLYILPGGHDNLIAPAAVMSMLVFGSSIPWARLTVSDEDILSRRAIEVGFFAETAHLVFLGALLFAIDPGFMKDYRSFLSVREATLAFFLLLSAVIYYAVTTVVMTTSGLLHELNRTEEKISEDSPESGLESSAWGGRLQRYIKPFIMTPEGIRGRIQTGQIYTLARQMTNEKRRNAQLTLLLELSQQLESQLDPPVSAQLAVNTLERALHCGLVMLFVHEQEKSEFMLLAAAGRHTSLVPTGFRQNSALGVIGRALRQRKTQIVNDIPSDPDYIRLHNEESRSAAVIPMIFNGHVHGMIVVSDEKANAFGSLEIELAETVAAELMRAWERSGYHQRLMELIQTGSQLSSALDPESAAQEIASISRQILQAKFTYIHAQLGQERNFIQQSSSGYAPSLLESLKDARNSEGLIEIAMRASQPFRIRDARKYAKSSNLSIDNPGLRSLLVIPIHWHQVSIGAIFAFGKQNEVFFTENDQSLAELIAVQAGGAFESTSLQQQLRSSLRITSLLYRLSNQIIQAENIEDAASNIAQTAHKLGKNLATGIVLLSPEGSPMAEIKIDAKGQRVQTEHPLSLVHDAMQSGQLIYIAQEQSILRACLPIQTPIRIYGALWMDTPDDPSHPSINPNDLQALANQSAIALERSLLLAESQRQAKELTAAYDTLETTYDQTLASLSSALDARDRETEGHSARVTQLALRFGEFLGYSQDQLKILERGSLLHDIGKIGVSDTILHKPGALTEDEWKIMRQHPDIGARIVEGVPFLQDTIPLIRHHQERWNGTGYPGGLKGAEIPGLARLFAVVDAFDALTSNRPYRQSVRQNEALAYLKEMSGIHFDPAMVASFEALFEQNPELISGAA